MDRLLKAQVGAFEVNSEINPGAGAVPTSSPM